MKLLFQAAINGDDLEPATGEILLIRQLLLRLSTNLRDLATSKHDNKTLRREQWSLRVQLSIAELCGAVPPHQTIILVDEGTWGQIEIPDRPTLPFPEQAGKYAGQPATGESAVAELKRLIDLGASYAAFPETSFWWLEQYAELKSFVRERCVTVLHNDRLQVFHLQHTA